MLVIQTTLSYIAAAAEDRDDVDFVNRLRKAGVGESRIKEVGKKTKFKEHVYTEKSRRLPRCSFKLTALFDRVVCSSRKLVKIHPLLRKCSFTQIRNPAN